MLKLRVGVAAMTFTILFLCSAHLYATDWTDSSYFSWANFYDTVSQETVSYVTPARHNQNEYSQCGVMSACAAIEAQILLRLNKPDSNVDVSEQMAISCWTESTPCFAYYSDLLPHATSTGIPTESCLPYDDTDPCVEPDCEDACVTPYAWATVVDTIRIPPKDLTAVYPWPLGTIHYYSKDSLKSLIVENGPIAVKLWIIFEDLTAWGLTDSVDCGPWDDEYPPKDSTRMVGHWVMIYGWDDECTDFDTSLDCYNGEEIPCWLAKNSVGSDWGDPGADSVGEEPGCFKLIMDEPLFRTDARIVEWTPLAKPTALGPAGYSAIAIDTVVDTRFSPPDTTITPLLKFVWNLPSQSVTDFRINIAEHGELLHTAVVEDTVYDWDHPEEGYSYTWYIRAFDDTSSSEKASDWSIDTVSVLSQPCCSNRGDFDHNGVVDSTDIYALSSYMYYDGFYPGCWKEADVDGDQDIDIADLIYLSQYVSQSGPDPCPCDSTCN